MNELPETIDGLPNLCGAEALIEEAKHARPRAALLAESRIDFGRLRSACAIALHMHQPLIPAGGDDLRTAAIISNLKHMMENPSIGDNHNAARLPLVLQAHGRVHPAAGRRGQAAAGDAGILRHAAARPATDGAATTSSTALKRHLRTSRYRRAVEWLGAPGGTPWRRPRRCRISACTCSAWQHHFAAIFGTRGAGARARLLAVGDGAAESPRRRLRVRQDAARLRLPVGAGAGAHGRAARNGQSAGARHLPHRLVCRNSAGQTPASSPSSRPRAATPSWSAQMQPYYEASGLVARSSAAERCRRW